MKEFMLNPLKETLVIRRKIVSTGNSPSRQNNKKEEDKPYQHDYPIKE